jgi:hypothetical protein
MVVLMDYERNEEKEDNRQKEGGSHQIEANPYWLPACFNGRPKARAAEGCTPCSRRPLRPHLRGQALWSEDRPPGSRTRHPSLQGRGRVGGLASRRLGRSLKDLIAIVERLEERGVGLRSIQEQIDTMSASGRLFFHIMGALAEFERNLTRERTRAGLLAARRRGKKPGRKKRFANTQVKVARAMLKAGELTVAEVAGELKVSPATLYRYFPGGREAIE